MFGSSLSHSCGPGVVRLLPRESVGLPRGVVAVIVAVRFSVESQEGPSAELYPGEIRAEIQLSDGKGLARRPC